MLDERPEQAHGRIIPYHAEVERRAADVYVPVPNRRRRGPSFVAMGTVFLLVAAGAGYGIGRWRTPPTTTPAQPGALAASDTGDHATAPSSTQTGGSVVNPSKVIKRGVSSRKALAKPEADEPPAYVENDPASPPAKGFATIVPPESPPPYLAPSVPDVPTLSALLYGQQLVAKTLIGNHGWIVEPGEIIDLRVDEVWRDPAQISHGVYVTFVAMAEGKGIRASGLLRYYGDGSEGNRYVARDFMPSSVVRVGSW